jgi:hypothetical protein
VSLPGGDADDGGVERVGESDHRPHLVDRVGEV